ncbi:MAG: OmpA family protein [Gemmatimonadaceae bacterium]|nr:OmpA family protein [Gemmatimonadaceae bacterium]
MRFERVYAPIAGMVTAVISACSSAPVQTAPATGSGAVATVAPAAPSGDAASAPSARGAASATAGSGAPAVGRDRVSASAEGTGTVSSGGGPNTAAPDTTVLRDEVFFEFDSAELDADSRALLEAKFEILRRFPEIKLRIEGNTDARGSSEYNLALGMRRADAVRRFFVNRGIDPSRLLSVSFGEERPAVEGAYEDALARNRRDEFVLLPP